MDTNSNEGDESGHLSGKPFFDVILSKSHLHPLYALYFPSEINKVLPPTEVATAVLTNKDRKWNVEHRMTGSRGRFDRASWREFVVDNRLKEGDGLVFEVMECTVDKLEFKVHILRDETPPEIAERLGVSGRRGGGGRCNDGGGSSGQDCVIIIK
ncbi:hypothetical protein MLD38_010169 [Melastoma candidum]|uniref:Uncharacterized protein n=1 Tax=Melastoma candidum TaxID=119954 RepID=A0ACB9R2I0_9MYRT|nr:hypothetical protein MLD38_010169 [Melastoma candidum]